MNRSSVCAGIPDNRVDDGDIASGGCVVVVNSPGSIVASRSLWNIDVIQELPGTVVI